MIQLRVAVFSAFLFQFFSAVIAFAKPPTVTSIFPAGARQGAELELKVADVPETWPSSVWVDHSGIVFKPNKEKKGVYRMGYPGGRKILCHISHAGLQVYNEMT